MKKYTICAILNDGVSSIDFTASTKEESLVMLEKAKAMVEKMDRCGDLKKGEVIKYLITEWYADEDGDLIDILDEVYYERVQF